MLSSSSMDKLNLCLVRTLQYCSQFQLDICHHPGQLNIVPDTLSHLLNKVADTKNQPLENTLENIDKEVHTYHTTVIKMSPEFQDKIKKIYMKNKKWKEIIQQLQQFRERLGETSLYSYFINKDLVYYLDSVDA